MTSVCVEPWRQNMFNMHTEEQDPTHINILITKQEAHSIHTNVMSLVLTLHRRCGKCKAEF